MTTNFAFKADLWWSPYWRCKINTPLCQLAKRWSWSRPQVSSQRAAPDLANLCIIIFTSTLPNWMSSEKISPKWRKEQLKPPLLLYHRGKRKILRLKLLFTRFIVIVKSHKPGKKVQLWEQSCRLLNIFSDLWNQYSRCFSFLLGDVKANCRIKISFLNMNLHFYSWNHFLFL